MWMAGLWLVAVTIGVVVIVLTYLDHKKFVRNHRERMKALEAKREQIQKLEQQVVEFEQWIEATKDKCEVCGGNHHVDDCPNLPYPQGYEPYGALLEADSEGIDPTELFQSEAMKAKRELRQFQESLKAELPEDHPKKKGR